MNPQTEADKKAISEGCYFDPTIADEGIIKFAHKYYKPQYIKGKFTLLDWQKDYFRQLYGWRKRDGTPRFSRSTVSMSKKQGKNVCGSILCFWETLKQGQSNFVVSASTTRFNAKQVYDEIHNSIIKNPALKPPYSVLAPSLKTARFPSKNAIFCSISSDSGNAEGLNLSAYCLDEAHGHESDKLYRTLEYSTIARNGLGVVISTAGSDPNHFWYSLVQKARNVRDGIDTDTTLLPLLYEPLDSNPDIDDPAVWRQSCPSLGISFTEEQFKADLEAAKKDTASLLSFKRYRLNMWCSSESVWITPELFDSCKQSPPIDLREYPLFVACDLSQTVDCSSLGMCWALPDNRFYIKSHSWVCDEGSRRRDRGNLPSYRVFAEQGDMTITPGTANDYRRIKAYILDLRRQYRLKEVTFDQFNALELAGDLMAEGIQVFKMPQNHRHFTGPIKSMEVGLKERRIGHDGNRLLKWAFQNARLDYDAYSNVKLDKDKSGDKIDPCIASVMAYARALDTTVNGSLRPSIYESRSVFSI